MNEKKWPDKHRKGKAWLEIKEIWDGLRQAEKLPSRLVA
jgi:hypothetical protein